MKEVPLTLENLKDLDFGKIGVAFNSELVHVVKDCLDRPGDKKTRKVQITFLLAPVVDSMNGAGGGVCDSVDVGCEITSSVPKRRTQIYTMKPRTNGAITFHPDLPRDPEGSTLYDDETPNPDRINKKTGELEQ